MRVRSTLSDAMGLPEATELDANTLTAIDWAVMPSIMPELGGKVCAV